MWANKDNTSPRSLRFSCAVWIYNYTLWGLFVFLHFVSAIKCRIKKNVFVFELGFYSVPSLICFLSYSSFSSLNNVWSHKQSELKESVEAGEEKPLWSGPGVSSGVAQALSVSVLRTSDPRVCVCVYVACVPVCSCWMFAVVTVNLWAHVLYLLTPVSVCVCVCWVERWCTGRPPLGDLVCCLN